MRPSMSICTPRAWPSSGRNSEYGKLEPTISSVSHSCIRSQLGFVPSRPIEPGHEREVVGERRLAEQRLGDAGAERVRDLQRPRRRRASAPCADEHRDLLARVQDLGGPLAGRRRSARSRGARVARARVHRAVRVGRLAAQRPTPARSLGMMIAVTVRSVERDPAGAVDEVADLRGLGRHLHVLVRDVLEQRLQVDLLLVVAAERRRAPAGRRSRRPAGGRASRRRGRSGDGSRPGPEVAMQTPTSPVNFACAHAMNAAISSWRTWMNSGR